MQIIYDDARKKLFTKLDVFVLLLEVCKLELNFINKLTKRLIVQKI